MQRVRTCLLPSTLFRTVETDCSLVLGSNPLLIIGSLPTEQYTLKRSIESNYQVPARCTRRGVLYVTGGVVFAEGSLSLSLSLGTSSFSENILRFPVLAKPCFPFWMKVECTPLPPGARSQRPFSRTEYGCCAALRVQHLLSSAHSWRQVWELMM